MANATAKQAVDVFVERIMHDAHLRYQRQELKPQVPLMPLTPKGLRLDCPEVRGVKREASVSERKAQEFKPEWFTHLRPNFWKGYFETIVFMTRR